MFASLLVGDFLLSALSFVCSVCWRWNKCDLIDPFGRRTVCGSLATSVFFAGSKEPRTGMFKIGLDTVGWNRSIVLRFGELLYLFAEVSSYGLFPPCMASSLASISCIFYKAFAGVSSSAGFETLRLRVPKLTLAWLLCLLDLCVADKNSLLARFCKFNFCMCLRLARKFGLIFTPSFSSEPSADRRNRYAKCGCGESLE